MAASRRRGSSRAPAGPRQRVQVVVLGDFGRSPRMQYHALSLADQASLEVDVVAYTGSTPREEIVTHPHIHLRLIAPPPAWLGRCLPRVLALAVRVATQLLQLLALMLIRLPRPRFVLLQTPPCAPSFTVCRLVSFLRGATFIIDWHNFAYTLMGLKLGETHFLVRLAKRYERVACAGAHKHICVTSAMREWLREEWNVENATVLHDKPPGFFQPGISAHEAHDLFLRLEPILDASDARHPDDLTTRDAFCFGDDDTGGAASTPITTRFPDRDVIGKGGVEDKSSRSQRLVSPRWRLRSDRPCVLVSSTSWTPDEDFGVLLSALEAYDAVATREISEISSFNSGKRTGGKGESGFQQTSTPGGYLPNLLVIVTGKGPQRSMYERRMRDAGLKHVCVRTAWVESEDYPKVLSAADLGVCLHTSSSGLDLPMKVVDMFGAGLPVLAARYDTIHELVVSGEEETKNGKSDGKTKKAKKKRNGALFSDAKELAAALTSLLRGWGEREIELDELKAGALVAAESPRWAEHWEKHAAPLFRE
jgi:beta-1,4-mannosyltransferase